MKKQNLIKRFAGYYKPHLKLFIIDMCCAFLISAFNLVYPSVTQRIISRFVPQKELEIMLAVLVALFVFYIVKALLNYVLQYWGHMVGVRIQSDMRRELFDHIQKLPFKYFDDNKTGVIMSRMTSDLFEISELAHHGPEDVFLSLITIIGAFIILCLTNLYLGLLLFAFIPPIAVYLVFMRKNMSKTFREMRRVQGEINADIETSISGIRVSRAFSAKKHEKEKFLKSDADFVEARRKQYFVMGQFFSSTTFFLDFLYFAVLLAGGLFFYYDIISVADFTMFILYISVLIAPIRTFMTIYEEIANGASGFCRFCEIIDEPTETDSDNAITLGEVKGDIEFKNVSFGYSEEEGSEKVIKNFSMKVEAGKTVALVGPSGGGKSTICHLIPRFYEIDEGEILLDGVNITDIKRDSLREKIGIVQQDVFLFNGTIKENIAYGNFDATDEEIYAAAKKANIDEFVNALPDKYDTEIGERGVKLSGGQKQRISIARVFLKNPPVLILDEATSALDNATEKLIQKALDELSSGRTVIVVAHRLSTVKNADEIIVITSDGIAERGNHEELMKIDNGIYKNLYEYQFKRG